jgi:drug/metabolite transporter (DMT)-like permease
MTTWQPPSRLVTATLVGLGAIILWSTGGPLLTLVPELPPFQLIAMTFVVFFVVMVPVWLARGQSIAAKFRMPAKVWLVGVAGPWGYTICFFISYQMITPVHASLLLLSWPVMLLLGNAILRDRRIRWWHGAGALAGFGGAVLLVMARQPGAGVDAAPLVGYLIAAAGAVCFFLYSFCRSGWPEVATDAGALFCLGGAVLSVPFHLAFETTVMPGAVGWAVIATFGLGNVMAALYAWDFGMKFGQVRSLVALSYLTPLLTALLLIAIGASPFSATAAIACLLIVGGAFLGSRDLFMKRPAAVQPT